MGNVENTANSWSLNNLIIELLEVCVSYMYMKNKNLFDKARFFIKQGFSVLRNRDMTDMTSYWEIMGRTTLSTAYYAFAK